MGDQEGQVIESRDRIFGTAARLFAERGIGAVSMREIAESAHVSKPMLYYYFESKNGLCKALMNRGMEKMIAAIERIVAAPISVREKLHQIVAMRFRGARENADVVKFYINIAYGSESAGLRQEFMAQIRSGVRSLTELLAEGQARGEFRSDVNPAVAANVLLGAVNQYVAQHIADGSTVLDDRLADTVMSLFAEGFGARPDAA